jgi:transposase
MRYAGLDVHKQVVEAVCLNAAGTIEFRVRLPTTRAALTQLGQRLGPDARVALEATTNTWSVVAVLQPLVREVVVANPHQTRAIAAAKIKTDRVDALVLAQLLRCDYLPRVWQPDPATQALRALASRRAVLTAEQTRLKNRLHAVGHQALLAPPVADLFGPAGRAWLQSVPLAPGARATVDSDLRLLAAVEREVGQVSRAQAQAAHADPRIRLLLTLAGVDVAVAQGLVAVLGDPTRFRDGDHAASYLGLVPSTRQSADHCYHGPITKRGASHARWLLVQAAQHLDRHPGPLGMFFRRLAARKNRNVAVVATARKLVVIAWHMLTRQEPYRYAQPRATAEKLARVRRAAGARRRPGPARGTPRAPAYGTGARTRAVPALPALYRAEGLPAPPPLPPGEHRMLGTRALTAYAADLQRAHRTPSRACCGREVALAGSPRALEEGAGGGPPPAGRGNEVDTIIGRCRW